MMRYGYLLIIICVLTVLLLGCNNKEDDDGEVVGSEFEKVGGNVFFKEYRHIKTGCHYLYGNGMTPMFIEKDGRTVPYCD